MSVTWQWYEVPVEISGGGQPLATRSFWVHARTQAEAERKALADAEWLWGVKFYDPPRTVRVAKEVTPDGSK